MQLKKKTVDIGDRELEIKEFTCLGRNALLDIIGSFTFAEIMKSIAPLLDELGVKVEASDEDPVGSLISLGLQNESIWGGLVACLISVLQIGPEVVCLSLDSSDPEVREYVCNNMTVRQEPIVLQEIIKLNELPVTIKNYKALVTSVKSLMKN